MPQLLFLILFLVLKVSLFAQNNTEYQHYVIEYNGRDKTLHSMPAGGVEAFYYTADQVFSQKLHQYLVNIHKENTEVFDRTTRYNIIFYFEPHAFLSSNIIDNNTALIFNDFGDIQVDPKTDILRVLVKNIHYESVKQQVITGILLHRIKKQLKWHEKDELLSYNARYVHLLCKGYYHSEDYRYHVYSTEWVIPYMDKLETESEMSRLVKNDENIFIEFLISLRREKGWGLYLKLFFNDYSLHKFDAVFFQVYGEELDSAIHAWLRKRQHMITADLSMIQGIDIPENASAERPVLPELAKKDIFRFNGLLIPYHMIMSRNDKNIFLIPYKDIYLLCKYSGHQWERIAEIKYKGSVADFVYLNDRLFLVGYGVLEALYSVADIRSGNVLSCEIDGLDIHSGKIADYDIGTSGDGSLLLKILSVMEGRLEMHECHLTRKGNKYTGHDYSGTLIPFDPACSENTLQVIHADSFHIIHSGIYHRDTVTNREMQSGFNCRKCEHERTLSYFVQKKYEDSVYQLITRLREEEIRHDGHNLIPKGKYRNAHGIDSPPAGHMKRYELKVMADVSTVSLFAADMLDYYPVFENNGEFNYVMPGAIAVQQFADLYSNHAVSVGFKLPFNLEGSDVLLKYLNRKHRGNWSIAYGRHVRYLNISPDNTWTDSTFIPIPNQRKLIADRLSVQFTYPLRKYWLLGFESRIQRFKTVFSAVDQHALIYPDTVNYWNDNHLFVSKTNHFLNRRHAYHLQAGIRFFTYNWQGMSPEWIGESYIKASFRNQFLSDHVVRNQLNASLNIADKKVMYNIAGVDGNVFPLIDSMPLGLQNSHYLLMKYVSPFRGSAMNEIRTDSYILHNLGYYYGLGDRLAELCEIMGKPGIGRLLRGMTAGFYFDNLFYRDWQDLKFRYRYSLGPLLSVPVNKYTFVEYSYHIPFDGKGGVWYISLKNDFRL